MMMFNSSSGDDPSQFLQSPPSKFTSNLSSAANQAQRLNNNLYQNEKAYQG